MVLLEQAERKRGRTWWGRDRSAFADVVCGFRDPLVTGTLSKFFTWDQEKSGAKTTRDDMGVYEIKGPLNITPK